MNSLHTKTEGRGISTPYYTDVKMPVRAGMPFGIKDYKIRTIGYDVYRHYFDSPQKDCQVGSERIKRILNKR